MEEFLRRIKLIDDFKCEFNVDKHSFITSLKRHVDEKRINGLFQNPFEIFSGSKNEYVGEINFDKFKIRRRQRMFDTSWSTAIASGVIRSSGEGVSIEIQLNGLSRYMMRFYILLPLFYILFIAIFIFVGSPEKMTYLFLFILFHSALMLGVPYMVMRRGVRRMKYSLERDFYYFTRDL